MFEVVPREILRLILRSGKSLTEFAEASGVSLVTIRKVIVGKSKLLTMKVIQRLANALNVPPESLIKEGD